MNQYQAEVIDLKTISMLNFIKNIISSCSRVTAIFLPFYKTRNISQIEKYTQIGKISSGLIHDLASPITALNIQMEILEQETKKSKCTENMKQTISGIFEYCKLMKVYISGSDNKIAIDLGNEIQRSIELISYNALRNRIQIIFIRESNVQITANIVHIYQIMISLISNAIESFKPEFSNRKIIIKLERINHKIIISIQDFGIGMQNTKIIFKTFYTTKREIGGTGIGLSSVKRIVEKELKGKIEIQSKVNEGSIFKIILNH